MDIQVRIRCLNALELDFQEDNFLIKNGKSVNITCITRNIPKLQSLAFKQKSPSPTNSDYISKCTGQAKSTIIVQVQQTTKVECGRIKMPYRYSGTCKQSCPWTIKMPHRYSGTSKQSCPWTICCYP